MLFLHIYSSVPTPIKLTVLYGYQQMWQTIFSGMSDVCKQFLDELSLKGNSVNQLIFESDLIS